MGNIIDLNEYIDNNQRKQIIDIIISDFKKKTENYSVEAENELYDRLKRLNKQELNHLKHKIIGNIKWVKKYQYSLVLHLPIQWWLLYC